MSYKVFQLVKDVAIFAIFILKPFCGVIKSDSKVGRQLQSCIQKANYIMNKHKQFESDI